ncbi:MAG: hypothetical protein WCD45_01120 [Gallionella sp.]
MTQNSTSLQEAQQKKLQELHLQQAKLKELQTELANLNAKIENNEKLSAEDTKFVGELGWLSALSVSIATIAASV